MTTHHPSSETRQAPSRAELRERQRADALRDNLRKRKVQQQSQQDAPAAPEPDKE